MATVTTPFSGSLRSPVFNTIVKMAEAGHFQPFVARFNQGNNITHSYDTISTDKPNYNLHHFWQDLKKQMATALIQMQLKDSNIKVLKDKQFTHNLVQRLSSSAPPCKAVCLRSIKRLVEYPKMVK